MKKACTVCGEDDWAPLSDKDDLCPNCKDQLRDFVAEEEDEAYIEMYSRRASLVDGYDRKKGK